MKDAVLTVIQETEILGKKIMLYGNIESPLFLAKDVAEWIDYSISNVSKMLKSVDNDEKTIRKFCTSGSNYQTEAWFLIEDGLYECCTQSKKPIAKQMKKEIKQYLKSIRLTGAAIPEGREQEMVNYYFSGLSSDLQGQIVNELISNLYNII